MSVATLAMWQAEELCTACRTIDNDKPNFTVIYLKTGQKQLSISAFNHFPCDHGLDNIIKIGGSQFRTFFHHPNPQGQASVLSEFLPSKLMKTI